MSKSNYDGCKNLDRNGYTLSRIRSQMPQEKILIVEDSKEILDGLQEFFAEEDYDTTGVSTGDAALKAFYQLVPSSMTPLKWCLIFRLSIL